MQSIADILKTTRRTATHQATAATATPTTESYSASRNRIEDPPPPSECCCNGLGWIYRDDGLDLSHPWTGRAFPCLCTVMAARGRRQEWLSSACGLSPVLRTKTLSAFTRARQPEAYDAVADFALGASPQPWLLLQGGTGTGKTHLAAAAVNALVGQGVQATYAYVPDMLESLRWGYEDGTHRQQWEFLRTAQALILDDIHEHQTAWVADKLTDLVDYRLRQSAPTLIAMNLSITEVPERVRSRLSDATTCRRIIMHESDYRLIR